MLIPLLMKSIREISLIFLVCLLLAAGSYGDCALTVLSATGEALGNAPVTVVNASTGGTVFTNTTDDSGIFRYNLSSCDLVNFSISYAVSNYSATLTNASASSEVYLNDLVSARVQIKNTLGSYLEGQDCAVVVYKANSSDIVHDYKTQCQKGEPYLDCSGSTCNWASVTNCAFSDSLGWYYFQGRTDESLGYEYGGAYDLVFVCNGKSATASFSVGLDKAPGDMDRIEALILTYGGFIVVVLALGVVVLVFFGLLWAIFGPSHKNKR